MDPLPHQKAFIVRNPPKAILNWEMRVGKTLPASIWIDLPEQRGNTYIVCPKQHVKDWDRMNTKSQILTKEQFRKIADTITDPTAIVIDEAHNFSSPLFIKGRSKMAEALYNLVKRYPEMHILLLTATPIRQDAWSLHTLMCYTGNYLDWKKWRNYFFELKRMPFLRFPVWFPKKDWRMQIRPYVEKYTDIIALKDVVEYLPPPLERIIQVDTFKYVLPMDEVVTWVHEHQWEQQNKVAEILNLGYKKIIVVCHYTDQIDEFAKKLADNKPVFILDGRTKDADIVKVAAQEAEECYFIVQASMGFGFDGWMFGAIVFASMSHSCTHHTQMLGRLTHTVHIRMPEYIYLIGGKWDKRIYDTIMLGKTFNPHVYLHESSSTT
jgi:hypothetical protein